VVKADGGFIGSATNLIMITSTGRALTLFRTHPGQLWQEH
jgi:hypothetical protein